MNQHRTSRRQLIRTVASIAAGALAATAAGSAWPASVIATCGDITVRIDGPKMWTLSRIEFRGTRLGIEESAYGTVLNFPEVGFVGSAHRDGGAEQAHEVEFFLDGRRLDAPGNTLMGRSFRVAKRSSIRDVSLQTDVALEHGRIEERVVVRTERAVPMRFGYHFMHAWTPSATAYAAGRDGEPDLVGELRDAPEFNRQFYINREMDWIAVYDGPSGKGVVSRLLERPPLGGAMMKLWNVPGVYRKFYLQCFTGQELPAGFIGTYVMRTGFFETGAAEWRSVARELARALGQR